MTKDNIPPILDVGGVLISSELLTECFCCDLSACRGACCIEGDAGAPVADDEVASLRQSLDAVWPLLTARAQSAIDRRGVVYTDPEGELVTTIVDGRDCVFAYRHDGSSGASAADTLPDGCCLCALEKVCREGRTDFMKPISCALYPIRERRFGGGLVGLNLHHWDICRPAFERGRELGIPVYRFLREPLVRRFGEQWYAELAEVAAIVTAAE